MHEFALAEAVVDSALRVAEREGFVELCRVVVRIGELQEIERDVFAFALQEVIPAAESRLAATVIDLEVEEARFRCRACAASFGRAEAREVPAAEAGEAIHFVPELAHAFLRCPSCDSPDFEVTAGRGVRIHLIEGN